MKHPDFDLHDYFINKLLIEVVKKTGPYARMQVLTELKWIVSASIDESICDIIQENHELFSIFK